MKIPQILGGNAFDMAFHGALEYQHIINHTTDESGADFLACRSNKCGQPRGQSGYSAAFGPAQSFFT